MDQVQAVIRQKILAFHQLARQWLPVRKMLLYGSHARGQATGHSDIDVAVIVDEFDHAKRIETTAKLFHLAAQVDPAIEPKCIFWTEYQNHDRASILAEIIKTGIEII